ncbi:16737_t:CDS:2 [Entrophospora sp. SA101]|nr:16737_t:CDS:2 [Entrophospora sp. SA101]
MIRYIILIFLVGLVTVLYFATTQQVLKPSGVGPLIVIDNFYQIDRNKNIGSESTTENQQTFDSNKVAHLNSDYYTLKDNVQGILYDRGDGCNTYNPYKPEQKPANAISPVLPPNVFPNKFIGLVTSDTTNCSIDDKINKAIEDGVSGVIIIMYDLDVNNARIPVFSIDSQDSPKITQSLEEIYNNFSKGINDNLPYRVLRASLRPYQPIIVSSWLFAMFAVGGILVISFFVSILIHMRLYRMRRNQQDEIRRQRDAEDLMGMKKWTLGKEIVNTFPVIIYQKKKKIVNDDDSDKNSNKDNSSTATGPVASINRTASMKSIRSTRSTRSTRSVNAINNATNLYNNKSKEEHIIFMEESSSSIDKNVLIRERLFRRNRSASGNNNSNNESLRLENINRTTS